MAYRMSATEKWNDSWFLELSANAKLLFLFLCDKCDIAGFFERHDKSCAFMTGIPVEIIPNLYGELSKSVIIVENTIWLKNFVRIQKNLPLNPANTCHKSIIRLLIKNGDLFGSFYDLSLGFSLEKLKDFGSPLAGASKPLPRGYSNSNSRFNTTKSTASSINTPYSIYGGCGEKYVKTGKKNAKSSADEFIESIKGRVPFATPPPAEFKKLGGRKK